jgi:hypothetical protein
MLPRHEAATAHIAHLPVTSQALGAAHDAGCWGTHSWHHCGGLRDRSHITAAANAGAICPAGAMLCRTCAAGDIIAEDGRSAWPRYCARAGNEALLPASLGCQDAAARGELAAALPAPSPQRGSEKRAWACPTYSSAASVGLSERSRSTGCTSPASARGERGGRGSGRTKRSRAVSLEISTACAGDAAGTAACCRLQPTVARASPNLSSILDVTQHSEAPCGEG